MSEFGMGVTTYPFELPQGLLDREGKVHREGLIRPATGLDSWHCYNHAISAENPAYGALILLSRAILRLGDLSPLTPQDLENLFLPDLEYLQNFYNAINPPESQVFWLGESSATPKSNFTRR